MNLLLKNYNNVDYVMRLPFQAGIEMIKELSEDLLDKKLWDMWISLYPKMDKKTFIPFSEFKGKNTKPQDLSKKELSKEDIMAYAENVKRIHQERR